MSHTPASIGSGSSQSPTPLNQRHFGGLAIFLVSTLFTIWTWDTAIYQGYFYVKASMLFPAIAVLGSALIFLPGYREERIARGEDISHLKGVQLLTRRWRVILGLSLAVGISNYVLLSHIVG